ncbi:GLUG motif-containing protein [Salibacterium qingdaonense]|uniref:The GLUG motif-containing protein n=1 Tax=Salibacterium qingdaonense TaxID=266892 RepID=A0A1I4QNC6_9BACI|nr:GLUG motif-containing protein [Salibacterium qingdaonense]SFM41206.1 The GLUG motif-containing protein [Salibacterium qingdaonense]
MANGNFAGGNGSESNPYQIEDAHDLDAVRNDLTAYYELINDIDLDVSPYNEGEGWNPIGDYDNAFKGTLHGQGFEIKKLFIEKTEYKQRFGLFGFTNGSTIEGLKVTNVNLLNVNYAGIIVGNQENGSKIANSFSNGKINEGEVIGGLVGYNDSSTIENSFSFCEVNGSNYIGGLIGRNYGEQPEIYNSYSTGKVQGESDYGGLIGSDASANSVIYNSFWDTKTSTQPTSAGGIGLTTSKMQDPQTFIDAGWDEEKTEDGKQVWILKNGEYPKLWFDYSFGSVIFKAENEFIVPSINEEKNITYLNKEFLNKEDFDKHGIKGEEVNNVDFKTLYDKKTYEMKQDPDNSNIYSQKLDLSKMKIKNASINTEN